MNTLNNPTMQDIADRVGVAKGTVSNVLAGRFTATRSDAVERAERIRTVAMEMGYRPSAAARTTRTGRTGYLGLLRSSVRGRSVFSSEFECGMDRVTHERGLCLLSDKVESESDDAPRIVRENAVDGLLINYALGTPGPIRDLIDRCGIPAIWINRKRDENCVRPHDEGAAYQATQAIIQQGHRRIAWVQSIYDTANPSGEPHYSTQDRRVGYARAMVDAGLTPRVETLTRDVGGAAKLGGVLHNFSDWLDRLDRPDRPSAVLCADYGRVMVTAALARGLRVPEDLSIMTFDNFAGGDEEIAVDRVLVRYRAMGEAAVTELCELIEDPNTPRKPVVIPFEFHRVGTVAAPQPPAVA